MFKAPNGRYITRGLFFEVAQSREYVMYTLKEEDHIVDGVTYPSLRKLYMSYDHVPGNEYDFANAHLGGWKHWTLICNSELIKPIIDEWREELEVKIRSRAVKEVIKLSGTEKGFQASKWLAEGGYAPKQAGRPTKAQVEREARIQADTAAEVNDMLHRIQ